MILQALYQLAQQEALVADPDYQELPVAWLIRIGPGGKLIGIEGTKTIPGGPGLAKGKKPLAIAKTFSVPRRLGKTANVRAQFLYENAEYVFGVRPIANNAQLKSERRLQEQREAFRESVEQCANATGDEGTLAIAAFLDRVRDGLAVPLPDDVEPGDLFAFVYSPDVDLLVHQRPKVRAYWQALRRQSTQSVAAMSCVVTGEAIDGPPNVDQLKKVPGGRSGGTSLVSFNFAASESHRWKRNRNAPVSRNAAEACITALNRLLDPTKTPRRSVRIAKDAVLCYWSSDRSADSFLDPLSALLAVEDPARVGDLYRSIWRGIPPVLSNPAAFYGLTMSGALARTAIRGWFVSTVTDVARNLAQHFADLLIVPLRTPSTGQDRTTTLPLQALIESLAPPGRDSSASPQLAAQFVAAALQGTPYPQSVLQRALERTRAEAAKLNNDGLDGWHARERQDGRSSLIKAVLRRNAGHKEIGEHMDPANSNPGYLLGRLLAVIERLQATALGEVNAGVVDRYFAAASVTPRSVFVRLLRNARHHARKALDEPQTTGTARWLERQIDEIAAPFNPKDNGFPAYLDLDQQGLFVLGYHQQRHWLWQSKEDRESASRSA